MSRIRILYRGRITHSKNVLLSVIPVAVAAGQAVAVLARDHPVAVADVDVAVHVQVSTSNRRRSTSWIPVGFNVKLDFDIWLQNIRHTLNINYCKFNPSLSIIYLNLSDINRRILLITYIISNIRERDQVRHRLSVTWTSRELEHRTDSSAVLARC